MTRGIGVGQDAREALVAGAEFVELIARDRSEAPPGRAGRGHVAGILLRSEIRDSVRPGIRSGYLNTRKRFPCALRPLLLEHSVQMAIDQIHPVAPAELALLPRRSADGRREELRCLT